MTEQVDIDCLGMKCPRPIIEIAKAVRKAPPGTILRVRADDLAFESDVRAWAEHTNAKILNLDQNGNVITVQLQLREA